jgi:hypothetical protein
MVDEAQDIGVAPLRFLAALGASGAPHPFWTILLLSRLLWPRCGRR